MLATDNEFSYMYVWGDFHIDSIILNISTNCYFNLIYIKAVGLSGYVILDYCGSFYIPFCFAKGGTKTEKGGLHHNIFFHM
jgi:hypothetical protein